MSNLVMRRPNLENLPPLPAMPAGYTLRDYRDSDLEPVAAMMRAAFHDDQWTPELFLRELINNPQVERTFIIEHDGLPVATASAQTRPAGYPGSGVVHWVAVDPEHRGLKLGYVVSLAVLHEFARRGYKDAVLETQDERLPAIKTYRKLGFEPEHTDETHVARWAEILSRLLQAINL